MFAVATLSLAQFYSILLLKEALSPYFSLTSYCDNLVGPTLPLNQFSGWLSSLAPISRTSYLLDLEDPGPETCST